MTTFCESGAGRPGTARRGSTRFTRVWVVVLAALCVFAFAPQRFAVAATQTAAAFFIGNDGTLYTYGRAGDGSVIAAKQLGAAQVAPPGGSVAATQAPGGGSVAFYVGNDGALYGACPDSGQVSQLTATGLGSPGEPNGAALVGGQTVYDAFVGAKQQLQVVEIHNPCDLPSVVLAAPALPPPPPHAELAAVGLADGEFGLFYVDGGGALQASWSSAAGAWTTTQLTADGTSAPGGGIAVTPNSGAPAAPGALSLFFTAHDGNVYLAHPLPGGKLSDNPQPSPSSKGTYVPDGAALAASSGSTGSVVGFVASDGALTGVTVTASGWGSVPAALTGSGIATAGSSAASASFGGDADFYCGTTLGRPTIIHWPHGGGGGGSVLYVGPSGLTGAATSFAAN